MLEETRFSAAWLAFFSLNLYSCSNRSPNAHQGLGRTFLLRMLYCDLQAISELEIFFVEGFGDSGIFALMKSHFLLTMGQSSALVFLVSQGQPRLKYLDSLPHYTLHGPMNPATRSTCAWSWRVKYYSTTEAHAGKESCLIDTRVMFSVYLGRYVKYNK